uniref:Uncharacterized protein n=1 Tax=Plectus sambesii TaxID=2011161 RepID=A0A914WUE3_9BILA
MTWSDAEDYCRRSGGPNSHLTSISSAFFTSDINGVAANNPAIGALDQVWIGAKGLNLDSSFIWVDGTPFIYTNWLPGQPQLSSSCVSTLARSSGRWRTEPCETQNYFICKYTMQPVPTPTDCYDWHFSNGNSTSGIYQISPPGSSPFNVYCDMFTDGGGWTVIQRRIDGTLLFFNQTWSAYKNGFNNGLANNQWLGNDRIHILSTKDVSVSLRIDIQGHIDYFQTYENVTVSDVWNNFQIGDENANYTLQVGALVSGNLSQYQSANDFQHFNGNMPFSTQDRGTTSGMSMAGSDGGWWYQDTTKTSLNGKFGSVFFFWVRFHADGSDGVWIFPYTSQMMLRRSG